jgi:20S proteasome subunit beta 5
MSLINLPVEEGLTLELPSAKISPEKIAQSLQYHGTTTLAFIYNDSVVVAVDSKASIGDYVGSRTVRKVLPIAERVVATMAGGAADCTHILRYLARLVRVLTMQINQPMKVGMIAR